jgi:hypothetical protein
VKNLIENFVIIMKKNIFLLIEVKEKLQEALIIKSKKSFIVEKKTSYYKKYFY